jgi:competence protein ComEA
MRTLLHALPLATMLLLGAVPLWAEPVNINTADAETLAKELVGIGPALAAAIIRDREENGPYEEPEDITRVSGIGERVLEDNRENIRVSDEDAGQD